MISKDDIGRTEASARFAMTVSHSGAEPQSSKVSPSE